MELEYYNFFGLSKESSYEDINNIKIQINLLNLIKYIKFYQIFIQEMIMIVMVKICLNLINPKMHMKYIFQYH